MITCSKPALFQIRRVFSGFVDNKDELHASTVPILQQNWRSSEDFETGT
jgi:hypothetical protein